MCRAFERAEPPRPRSVAHPRIEDAGDGLSVDGLLKLHGGNFRVGVMVGGRYARARLASRSGSVRVYSVAVPKDLALRLFLDSALRVRGPNGSLLEAGKPGLSVSPADQEEMTYEFRVE